MNEKLTLTNVSFLNGVPFRATQELPWIEYTECPPAEGARRLHEGETDLALIPLAEFFAHGGYSTLPYVIAANGPVESVYLFSDCPLEELEAVVVDRASQTSVILLRLILDEQFPQLRPQLKFHRMDLEEAIHSVQGKTGAIIIGDRSLLLEEKFRYRLDLSETWHSITGLPFVFAIWAYRSGSLSDNQISEISRLFDFGISQRSVFARDWAESHGTNREQAEHYVSQRIIYRLDETLRQGAQEFYRRGVRSGLFPAQQVHAVLSAEQLYSLQKRSLDTLLEQASRGERLSISEGLLLGEKAALSDLGLAADLRRQQLHSTPGVSYIIDRNINYTNVCNVFCQFCAFYRAPEIAGKKNKKSSGGYVLSKEELGQKIQETIDAGGIQILLQGGLNPELGIEYYEDLFRWMKSNYSIHLHALSADEILHISKVSQLSISTVISRLIAAGLGSLPGGGAEILVDRVRQRIARLKSPANEWLDVHRTAHRLGITSTCTMMFGVRESWEDRLLHLHKLRQLQDETGGFTAFITWPFQDDNVKLKRGDTSSLEYLRVQALARLFLDNIRNIQSSWVTMGPSVGQAALFYGANDFGSVMFEENVVSAAGTTYCMNSELIVRHIQEAGFIPWQRNVHYQPVI